MVDGELEFLDQIDFENLFDNISEDFDLFEKDFLPVPQDEVISNSCDSPWSEVEQLLMNDDFDDKQAIVVDEDVRSSEIPDSFFSDLLADVVGVVEEGSSGAAAVEVRVSDGDCSNSESNGSDDNRGEKGSPDDCSNPESNVSDNSGEKGSPNDKEDEEEENKDDPISKKRKRQIRNRDAALRSRERKKMYVKELEVKSRYLENECRRLQHLLHCCYAENHNLHLQIGASMAAKQESAVLFLESLLLGSLLWFLGIVCLLLFPLQGLEVVFFPSRHPPANELVVSVGDKLARTTGNKTTGFGALRLFFKRKRSKMRTLGLISPLSLGVAPLATALVV
ncbi:hypothetical protein MKW98_018605 [Papaver atlanticum]|uniref:BZIP domain-containing protein n=1 Tax=Papaver atlanticum TaxID=357466 RepID=A0AAD4T6A6_9MAGN|nr:hypothetical protein MKW98_018605 [Papaver atlanticum]